MLEEKKRHPRDSEEHISAHNMLIVHRRQLNSYGGWPGPPNIVEAEAIMKGGGVELLLGLATSLKEGIQAEALKTLEGFRTFLSLMSIRIAIGQEGGVAALIRLASTHIHVVQSGAAGAYMFDGRMEEYALVAEGGSRSDYLKGARIITLKCVENFVSTFVDPHMFTAVSLSSASAPLAQATEAVSIVEAGRLLCSQTDIEWFVSMLRNKSPVLKSFAAFALLQFTVPVGRYAHHHVKLLQEAGASRVLRVTSAQASGPLEAKICAKIVLRNLEHQQMS